MPLETATYVYGLVTTNPDGGDSRTTLDDHARLIKAAIKRTFPNLDGEVSASAGLLNSAAFYGVRTNTAATISATHDYSIPPRYVLNGVAYPLGPVYPACVNLSGTMISPIKTGWSATYVGGGNYYIYHPLAKWTADGSLVAVVTGITQNRAFAVISSSASTYVEIRCALGSDGTTLTTGAFQALIVAL